MVETRDVPRADPFSFTAAGRPWVSHEWLFQLLAYGLFSALGSAGLMAAKGLVGAATLACVERAAARRSPAFSTRALAFLSAGAPVVLLGFTCRPQIVTYLGCALIVFLLECERNPRHPGRALDYAPWLLVPWSWLHGGFLAGAAIFALIGFGDEIAGRSRTGLFASLALALVATIFGPYGPRLWIRLAETFANPVLARAVLEWRPVWSCGEPLYQGLFVAQAVLLAAAFAGERASRKDSAQWLLAAAGLAAGAFSVRHLLLASILSVPALAAGLDAWRRRAAPSSAPPGTAALAIFGAAALTALAAVGLSAYSEVRVRENAPLGAIIYGEPGPAWVVYPKGAVDFMRARAVAGRVWNEPNVGGYLVWHLFPACRVSMDPRFEHVYSPEQMDEAAAALAAAPGWEETLSRSSAELLLLPLAAPLASAAGKSARWRTLYRDPDYVLLAGAAPRYDGLARDYARGPAASPRPPRPWLFP